MAKKKRKISKLSGGSLDIKNEQIEKLKSLFPQVVKDGEIDFDALKLALGSETDTNGLSYGLSWAGKADCFRHIQEATTATLKPIRGESVDFDNTENIFIEGDNLEVLKVLGKNYYGKIKMIYIDPPYNTGNDSFIYPDRFKEEKEDYELRAGIKDAEGLLTKDGFFRKNSKDTGHFHSNWLCMMYPRLFLAKNLLRQDGVIFVSIDDNEVHNLRMVMNEVFGEENFVAEIIWEKKFAPQNDAKWFSDNHDFILVFTKNKEIWRPNLLPRSEFTDLRYSNPDNDPRGDWTSGDLTVKTYSEKYDYPIRTPSGRAVNPTAGRCWSMPKKRVKELISEGRIWFGKSGNNVPRVKIYRSEVKEGIVPLTIWKHEDVGHNQAGRQELKKLFEDAALFDSPKPTSLMDRILTLSTSMSENDLVLDFFAGSCTTAHAVMQLNAEDGGNRKYICVQLAEPCDQKSEAFKAGLKTIADIGKERIRRAAKKIKAENKGKLDFDGGKLDLGFKVFKLEESNFKQWREDIKTGEELKEQLKMFVDNKKKGSAPEDMLYEIILKNSRFDLNVNVEKKDFDGIEYYVLALNHEGHEGREEKTGTNGVEIVCLAERITKKLAERILKEKPQKFTCLDTAFKNNDQLKTNTALQAEAAKIEFKVI